MENHLRDTIDDILLPKVEVNGLEVSGLTTLGMLSTFVSSQRLGFNPLVTVASFWQVFFSTEPT